MKYAGFYVASGEFVIWNDGHRVYECSAFAGRGLGRNNPDFEDVRNTGPIPRGTYAVREEAHKRFRKPAFRLTPVQADTHGRSGFWIHGGTESHGCVIVGLPGRLALRSAGVTHLIVVHRNRAQRGDLISDAQLTPQSGVR